ncbi:MAG: hypothetical protein AB7F31_03795 [Parachlamydiales bacterium]
MIERESVGRCATYLALTGALYWGRQWHLIPSLAFATTVALVVERTLQRPDLENCYIGGPTPQRCEISLLLDEFVPIEVESLEEGFLLVEEGESPPESSVLQTPRVRSPSTSEGKVQHVGKSLIFAGHWKIKIGPKIGEGALKTFYSGYWIKPGTEAEPDERGTVAIGVVALSRRGEIEGERLLRKRLPDSPFLTSCFELHVGEHAIFTLAPLYSPRPLRPLDWSYLRQGIWCVAKGLEVIHGRQLVHTDVKNLNLLWGPEGALLNDFDLVREVGAPLAGRGTPSYIDPAYPDFFNSGVQQTADIWALGITLQVLLWGKVTGIFRMRGNSPEHIREALDRVVSWGEEPFWERLGSEPFVGPPEAVRVRNGMLRFNPSDRPSATQVAEQIMLLKIWL